MRIPAFLPCNRINKLPTSLAFKAEAIGGHVWCPTLTQRGPRRSERVEALDELRDPRGPLRADLADKNWVAVKELNLSYHNMDIYQMIWFRNCGNFV